KLCPPSPPPSRVRKSGSTTRKSNKPARKPATTTAATIQSLRRRGGGPSQGSSWGNDGSTWGNDDLGDGLGGGTDSTAVVDVEGGLKPNVACSPETQGSVTSVRGGTAAECADSSGRSVSSLC